MEGKEQLNFLARWAIIGRLSASLFHEINNPMQTIQGAMGLAMEPATEPEELHTYLNLTLQESQRIMRLVARARRVYRPENAQEETFDLNELLSETLLLTREEMHRKKVTIQTDFDPSLPHIFAMFSELSLAILCPLLEMSDGIDAVGGGEINIASFLVEDSICVRLNTSSLMTLPADGFQLIVCREVVESYGGSIVEMEKNGRVFIHINLPLATIGATEITP